MSGLKYLYMGDAAADNTAFASIADQSGNGRTLVVSGTAAERPTSFPRNWLQGGAPVIAFDASKSQYAQDQTAGFAAYSVHTNQPNTYCAVAVEVYGLSGGEEQICGNWDFASANRNAWGIMLDGPTGSVLWRKLSTTGGGTQHIAATNVAGLRPGDAVYIEAWDAAKSWTLRVTRRARDDSDNSGADTVTTVTGSYATTADTSDHVTGITLATRSTLAAVFCQCRIMMLAEGVYGATTAADLVRLSAWVAARQSYALLACDAEAVLTYPTDYSDATHFDDSGFAILAAAGIVQEQAIATARGWAVAKNRGVIGDSRLMGTGASVLGTTDFRAVLAAGPFTGGYAPIGYGPIDDGAANANSKKHFARSGYTTRSQTAQTGHSQRSAHAASLDVFLNSATGTHRSVDVWHHMIGVNDLVQYERDGVDEWVRWVEYMTAQRIAFDGVTPAHVLYLEPVTGTTTTGTLQRTIRSRNRAYRRAVVYLRSLGYLVKLINTNDLTYHH